MDELIRVYFRPKAPFPRVISSNTLFGAICCGIKELYGKKEVCDIISREHPPFIMSSAFPFIESNEEIEHFFPKPITEPGKAGLDMLDYAKAYKKAAFLHEDILDAWLKGDVSELQIIGGLNDKYKINRGLILPSSKNLEFEIQTVDLTQNILNRLTSASDNFFYLTRAYFQNCGLFFLIRFFDHYRELVEAALRFLVDRGIGGDISTGKGKFEFFIEEKKFKEVKDGDFFITLSKYCPTAEELREFSRDRMWYEIDKIQGRCRDGIIKRSLFMFREGSTFPDLGKQVYGKIELVRDDQDAVEFGYAFPAKGRFAK